MKIGLMVLICVLVAPEVMSQDVTYTGPTPSPVGPPVTPSPSNPTPVEPSRQPPTAQDIIYCCGNHPSEQHCGRKSELQGLHDKFGCSHWVVQR